MFLQYHISCQYASLLMDRKFMFDETWRECSIGKQIKKRIQDKAKNKINPFILTFSYIFIIFLYFYNSCSLPMLLSWYSCSWTVFLETKSISFPQGVSLPFPLSFPSPPFSFTKAVWDREMWGPPPTDINLLIVFLFFLPQQSGMGGGGGGGVRWKDRDLLNRRLNK